MLVNIQHDDDEPHKKEDYGTIHYGNTFSRVSLSLLDRTSAQNAPNHERVLTS
jgi:hypothetical protein